MIFCNLPFAFPFARHQLRFRPWCVAQGTEYYCAALEYDRILASNSLGLTYISITSYYYHSAHQSRAQDSETEGLRRRFVSRDRL